MEEWKLVTLKEIASQYIDSEKKYGEQRKLYHYNCAEVILNACNDYYKLGADSKTLKAIVPFGGGMSSGRTCGALTGGVAVLGLMFAEEKPTTNEKLKSITNKWILTFEKQFGDINCKELKENHRDPENGCRYLILEAAQLLELIIHEYK